LPAKPEAFSRVLIDQALRESGWDLLDDRRVRFELDGHSGRPFAPRPNTLSPPSFRAEQADFFPPLCSCKAVGLRREKSLFSLPSSHRYAENLRAPFVILSNGKENWFWNYERADQRDAFRIRRFLVYSSDRGMTSPFHIADENRLI